MIAIIDYGCGNLFSLSSSLESLGIECKITGDKEEIAAADKIILPGVGVFEDAAKKLRDSGYVSDERFARLYVRELQTFKKYGKRRIEQELYRKGIDREIIREVLDETDFETQMVAYSSSW